jgi:hypothetical protein
MTPENIERLSRASALLKFVQDELDISAHRCECCGLTVRHNMDEHQISAQIEGMRNRLNRWIKAPGLQPKDPETPSKSNVG